MNYSSSQVLECQRAIELSSFPFLRRARELEHFLGELIPFYSRRGWPYKSEKERECIHVLPSLVVHAVGYEMIIGSHNTVYVICMWQALPCSPGMANVGAYNTVCVLIRLEGYIVSICHGLVALS